MFQPISHLHVWKMWNGNEEYKKYSKSDGVFAVIKKYVERDADIC